MTTLATVHTLVIVLILIPTVFITASTIATIVTITVLITIAIRMLMTAMILFPLVILLRFMHSNSKLLLLQPFLVLLVLLLLLMFQLSRNDIGHCANETTALLRTAVTLLNDTPIKAQIIVIVGQLLAHLNEVQCKDSNLQLTVHLPQLTVAVRFARMIEETAKVALLTCIHNHTRIERHAIETGLTLKILAIPPLKLLHTNDLTAVLGDELALVQILIRFHTQTTTVTRLEHVQCRIISPRKILIEAIFSARTIGVAFDPR